MVIFCFLDLTYRTIYLIMTDLKLTDLNKLKIKDLLALIRNRIITVTQCTQFFIDLIKTHNPLLNALVEERFSEALCEAIEYDNQINKNQIDFQMLPLLGLPITIKEMICVKGMKQTLGILQRKNYICDTDATVVSRLKSAGAIILGTTNVSELGFWFEGSNPIYGATNTPFDLKRTAGGSTAGEASLVGAGLIPLGIGSDIGGSLRIPAAFCGSVGFKPSHGYLPMTGHFPASGEYYQKWTQHKGSMTSLGAIARSTDDLLEVLPLLAGDDNQDPHSNRPSINLNKQIPLNKIRVYILSNPDFLGAHLVDKPIELAVKKCGQLLKKRGATVTQLNSGFFEYSLLWWLMRADLEKIAPFTTLLAPNKPLNLLSELSKALLGKPNHEWPALITSCVEKLNLTKDSSPLKNNLKHSFKIKQNQVTELLKENCVIISPTHPRPAMRHGQSLLRPFDFIYTGYANAFNLPAIQVPVGLTNDRLPIGVQIAAALDHDYLCFQIAKELENAFGGWQPPPSQLFS